MLMTDKFLKHLTPTSIIDGKPALKPGQANRDFYDAKADGGEAGLVLRLSSKGKKTWNFIYDSPTGGEKSRLKLGTYPNLLLGDAREKVRAHRKTMERGRDPGMSQTSNMTMKELIEKRIEAVKHEGLRSAKEIERKYNKDVLPLVGRELVKDFRINPHFNLIMEAKKDTPRMAGLIGVELKTLFNFAVGKGYGDLEYSPVAKAKFKLGMKKKVRNLKAAEITTLLDELPTFVKNISQQRIIKLILLTGCRLSEICKMRRDEVDTQKQTLTIRGERVKNGAKHGDFVVALNDQAMAIIRDAMRDTNNHKWVFPDENGEKPIAHHSIDQVLARAFKNKDFSIEKFTPHDLRRTVGTQMLFKDNNFGISRFDKALVLNHRSVTKENVSDEHYDMNEYLDEKREALAKWGRFIEALTPKHQLEKAA